ncbi:MAG: alpha/beta hydrolase [Chloroflexi bacterium]|nr:alpha/beta hydrolase [Chloroflexota bacterium]
MTLPREADVTVNGLKLYYREWPGEGSPVILVHGASLNGAVWGPVAEALSPPRRVLAPDMRGHGDSQTPKSESELLNWEHDGEDIAAFLHALDLRDVTLVGHSAGGAWAVYGVAHAPDRVRALVLIDPLIRPVNPLGDRFGGQVSVAVDSAKHRRHLWPSRQEAAQELRGQPLHRSWRQDVFDLFIETALRDRQDGQVELKCSPETEALVHAGTNLVDVWPLLPKLEVPVLLVEVERTIVMLPHFVDEVFWRLRHPWREKLEGVGHYAPLEAPDKVAEALRQFLATLEAGFLPTFGQGRG